MIDTKNLHIDLDIADECGYPTLVMSTDIIKELLDALERKDRLLNAACNALQLQPRQTREVWKDGIDIDIAVAHTKARDAAIEAITKELT